MDPAPRPLKVLFVTHTASLGGAAVSLRTLLQAYDEVEADLAVPRFHGTPPEGTVRTFFGPRVRRVFRCWLPFEHVYRGPPPLRHSLRSRLVLPLTWRATRSRFYRFLEAERFDAVHLNSVVLHPLLHEGWPFILHVREIVADAHAPALRPAASRARGVIFIDEATRAPFEGQPLRRSIVLNNPVDMRAVGRLPAGAAERLGGDPAQLLIFALIGQLSDEKGVPFAIEAFRGLRAPEARLLLVGQGAPGEEARLRRLAAGDARIVFWGVERDVATVYTLADHVLRGEPYPCVGRTTYEALYSGCGVVTPGDPARHGLFEYERFADRVRFYPPRDAGALCAVLASLRGRKMLPKIGATNVPGYVSAFDRFVRGAIDR